MSAAGAATGFVLLRGLYRLMPCVNIENYSGRNRLSDAKDRGHTEIVELPPEHGAKG